MALKLIIENESELPQNEAVRALYEKQEDGTYLLGVEGAVPKAKLDEFREANVTLKKEKEQLEAENKKFEDVDLEDYEELKSKRDTYENAKADNDQKVKELVEKRTERMVADHQKEIERRDNQINSLSTELGRERIDRALVEAGNQAGLRKEAVTDLIGRGRQVFKLDEKTGELTAVDEKGETAYGPNGEVMTVKDYVKDLAKSAPHLFDPSTGSGASPSGGGKGVEGANPWKADSWNLTKQGELIRDNPEEARRLAAQAGKTIRASVS